MENVSILCVGDSTVDRFFRLDEGEAEILCRHSEYEIAFKYGEKIAIEKYHKSYGGSALNTSIGFSRIGFHSSIATIVGEDTDGKDIIEFLNNNSVATENISTEGESNQSAVLIYKSERTIFSYHKSRDYGMLNLPKTNWIYFCSAGDGFEKIIDKIRALAQEGAKVAINPGSAELKNFDQLKSVANLADIIFLNKQEAELLFNKEEIRELLDALLQTGTKTAVITDGANGAYIASGQDRFHMGIAPSTLIDPTGAGDSFACGFTSGMVFGLSLEESAKWGMVNSASVISKIGANDGLLTAQEIGEKVKETVILKPSKI